MKFLAGILSLILLLSIPCPAGAISLVNKEVILEAQNYGVKRKQLALTDFLTPWLAYEEKAPVLNETTERAYVYTPFLLIANDARDKARSKQPVQLADSEKILADYAGCLVFSIIINGDNQNFADNIQVMIKQDKKVIKPYHAVTNPPVQTPWFPNEPQFAAHSYFYFADKDIALDKAIMLVVTAKDKRERRFYFDLTNFK
ncbi:hypothetical protein SCACP_18170 [Sporomusa carbonis]|uniref:hypothetical protein n=1 Tax=Sporomusa carbonis TaxID=3076075 RepID=UPI003A710499